MKTILLSLVFAVCAEHAAAQNSEISASREAAARELVDVMNLEPQLMSGATAMMNAMVAQTPQLEDYRDVILGWAESVLTWEVFGPKLTAMYAEAFTENELRDLAAFYRTPTGQKALTLVPELINQAAQMGVIEAQSRRSELEQLIQQRAAELQRSRGAQ
jgi:hypothetical protein